MPFKSKAQARFMFAKHPEMAKEWEAVTPSIGALPEKKGGKKKRKTKKGKKAPKRRRKNVRSRGKRR